VRSEKMIDKLLNNFCKMQGIAEPKITTCLSPPDAGEFRNLAERSVEFSKLFNQRRKLSSPENS
jgi:hypothetical protein